VSTPSVVYSDQLGTVRAAGHPTTDESNRAAGAVSWGAILAGAAAAAALSLILLILGTGLGLASVSPWAQSGVSATTFGITTILWVTFTQIAASGMGGYLAGRLRTKWVAVHTDEVYFRDTAHGFLSWAVASLATAALLVSVIGSIVSGGVQAGAAVAGGVTSTATSVASAGAAEVSKNGVDGSSLSYFTDSLFRKDATANAASSTPAVDASAASTTAASAAEMGRIFMTALRTAAIPPDDLRYAGQVVSQRTGLSQADAEKRVSATFERAQTALREAETAAKDAADKARKASSYAALWLFISLLIGAFAASLAATYGGRQRDN
jgi:hypothetical protein